MCKIFLWVLLAQSYDCRTPFGIKRVYGWDVPKYPNDGKQFNWTFVLDEKNK